MTPAITMDQVLPARTWELLRHLVQTVRVSSWSTRALLSATVGLAALASWRAGLLTWLRPTQQREDLEPGLFQKHSSIQNFTTASGHTYPKIRVFYHTHPQAAKLPKGIPLLVFIHGLGGNATQFAPLLTSLVNVAPCLAIDLPGCGLSDFKPDDPAAYTPAAFAELLASAIDHYRDNKNNQQVVLIAHSMGCSIASLLASSASPLQQRLDIGYIIGLVAICPRAGAPSVKEAATIARLRWMPIPVFDVFRWFDRRGGLDSTSVTRAVGAGVDEETKRLQQKFNRQSKSAVVLRFITAALPPPRKSEDARVSEDAIPWPGEEMWSGVKVPLFLVAGEADHVTPPGEVEKIAQWLSEHAGSAKGQEPVEAVAATEAEKRSREVMGVAPDEEAGLDESPEIKENAVAVPAAAGDVQLAQYQLSNDDSTLLSGDSKQINIATDMLQDQQSPTKHSLALKTTVFPSPAAHGLMYATPTLRILSGLIEAFLARHLDERLSSGWQLRHLTTSGKWDVKNLSKWQSIDPCSDPIAGVFRAMKTMREIDAVHNPREFVKRFGRGVLGDGVGVVVDISHDSPVYDPRGLEEGGVGYSKFPTVSKLPPTGDEVQHFISLIDELRASPMMQPENQPVGDGEGVSHHPTIGVHCHYGFNRTGFFLCCYLVERLGYSLQDAVEEFAAKRPPGVKHEHFVNELYVRYAASMERRGTVVW